jgi:hypothetical protein
MKKVLIMVVSCEARPYAKMIETSHLTWDSVEIEDVQTIYYCGTSTNLDTDKIKHFPIKDGLYEMFFLRLLAYEWALNNLEFDYVARVNSSCYVSKKKLLDYVQTLPNDNVFEGLKIEDKEDWIWGGGQFIISKDVLQKIVDNKEHWRHGEMEDKAMSFLVTKLGIPFKQGNACSINKHEDNWGLLSYGIGESITFDSFDEIADSPHYFYRVKQDQRRELDEYIMIKLHGINA